MDRLTVLVLEMADNLEFYRLSSASLWNLPAELCCLWAACPLLSFWRSDTVHSFSSRPKILSRVPLLPATCSWFLWLLCPAQLWVYTARAWTCPPFPKALQFHRLMAAWLEVRRVWKATRGTYHSLKLASPKEIRQLRKYLGNWLGGQNFDTDGMLAGNDFWIGPDLVIFDVSCFDLVWLVEITLPWRGWHSAIC